MIREYTRGKFIPDEISDVLGTPIYAQNYYFKALRDRLLSPHSTDLVKVSRYYFNRYPEPVVVDFEPSPLDGKFWCEEKRQFCHEQHIVYVPVFLVDRLSTDQFRQRVAQETVHMKTGSRDFKDDRTLAGIDVEARLKDPEILRWIDQEALRLFAEDQRVRTKKVGGVARAAVLNTIKRTLLTEVRRQLRLYGHLGPEFRRRESAELVGG